MGFNITALGAYIQNNGNEFARRSVAEAMTAKALIDAKQVQYNVKGTAAILKLDSGVTLVDGASCTRVGGSTIVLSNKNIVVKKIKDELNICPDALWNTFYASAIKQGVSPEQEFEPMFVNAIMEDRALKIAAVNEKLLWMGDSAGSGNMVRIDGINKQLVGVTASAATGTTIVEKLQFVFTSSNVDVRYQDDYRIFIGQDTYSMYKIALAAKNIYQPTEDLTLFGTTAKLFITSGLNGSGKAFAMRLSNLQLGLDGVAEADTATIRYSVETTNWYQDFVYALGIAVVFPEEVSIFTGV